jgi:two-component system, OmpR family, lantibiotic biosynthesis response regulator NisR/SpaR
METGFKVMAHQKEFGPLKLNLDSCQAFAADKELLLTFKEFQILAFMAEHPNEVLERSRFIPFCTREDRIFDPQTLTIHIKNIRRKLGSCKSCIQTVWGTGYMFVGFD